MLRWVLGNITHLPQSASDKLYYVARPEVRKCLCRKDLRSIGRLASQLFGVPTGMGPAFDLVFGPPAVVRGRVPVRMIPGRLPSLVALRGSRLKLMAGLVRR